MCKTEPGVVILYCPHKDTIEHFLMRIQLLNGTQTSAMRARNGNCHKLMIYTNLSTSMDNGVPQSTVTMNINNFN